MPRSTFGTRKHWIAKTFEIHLQDVRVSYELCCVYSPRELTATLGFIAPGASTELILRDIAENGFANFEGSVGIEELREHYKGMISLGFCRIPVPDISKMVMIGDSVLKERDEDLIELRPFSHLDDNWDYDALR